MLSTAASFGDAIQIETFGPHSTCTIQVVGSPGQYTGFDVYSDGILTAPVRFSSKALIFAKKVKSLHSEDRDTLIFDGLTAMADSGLELENSKIEVKLQPQKYPEVSFTLHIKNFDKAKWQSVIGVQPFHFLNIGMASAEVWHQHGQLFPTPKADPFPLFHDLYSDQHRISSKYNRQWSTTPALGSQTIPVIGLWSPQKLMYAAWDFQATRSWDGTESEIATGFCNRLLTPQTAAEHRKMLGYDENGKLRELPDESPFISSKPIPTDTPAQLKYAADLYEKEQDAVGYEKFVALVYPAGQPAAKQPAYPAKGESLISHARLIYSTTLNSTTDPNQMLWEIWQNDNATINYLLQIKSPPSPKNIEILFSTIPDYSNENEQFKRSIAPLKEIVADALIKELKYFRMDGEKCCFWVIPRPVTLIKQTTFTPHSSLHNATGWIHARSLIDYYRQTRKLHILPILDGVLNWTKKAVWTLRKSSDSQDFADVSSGPEVVTFLLEYYFTFKSDFDRRTSALQALDLACSYTFRNLSVWTSLNTYTNFFTPDNLKMLIDVTVHTGDQTLYQTLKQILNFKTCDLCSLNLVKLGKETSTDKNNKMRVVVGEKAAVIISQTVPNSRIDKYRCSGDGDFAFTVRSNRNAIELIISFPYADISTKSVVIIRKAVSRIPVVEGVNIHRSAQSPSTLSISDVQSGDMVVVGNPDIASGEVLSSE